MPLPIVAASLVGGIVAGIAQFFASRAGAILAGLGLSFIAAKGLSNIIAYVIADLNTALGMISASGVGGIGGNLAQVGLQFAAYAGLFDAINILISGYMAMLSLTTLRVFMARLK